MVRCDALIVGGGPAGSTCARTLRLAGWNVILLDRARFPRDKPCAGWITLAVFPLLDLTPDEYRATGLTFQPISGFRTSVVGAGPVDTRYGRVISYAIRRCEFDTFLVRRAGVCVMEETPLSSLRREGDVWIANDTIRTPVVIGAGGHFCPVARRLRADAEQAVPVIAKEVEFRLGSPSPVSGEMPELYFCRDLEGYGWCVRKGDYVNVGIGRRESRDFAAHVNDFSLFLESTGKAPGASSVRWPGHAYIAAGAGRRRLVDDGLLLVGDAAGLAYAESGEGIRPAIESGRRAAETLITSGGRVRRDDLLPYEAVMTRQHPASRPVRGPARAVIRAAGRALLRSSAFTRHVVLDRWFLGH